LELEQESLQAIPYRSRLLALGGLLDDWQHPGIELIETAFSTEEKTRLIEQLQTEKQEGAVFKRLNAPYTPGRPSSGGPQLKHKFYATLSAVVGAINEQRSVELRLFNGQTWQSAGNVTIPANHAVPAQGSVIEVRYLYAYAESGALYQPGFLGLRQDVAQMECSITQLKYKASNEEEES
jgi:bifunctional non-homologous end joining protein LigD